MRISDWSSDVCSSDLETMHYSLASGISFCRVAGRFIFLDVPRDRYFCLSAESERCFAQLVDGESLSQREHAVLAQLVAGRILKDAAEEAVALACQFTSHEIGKGSYRDRWRQ